MAFKILNNTELSKKIEELSQIESGKKLLKTDLTFKKKDGRFYKWLKIVFSIFATDPFKQTRIYNVTRSISEFYQLHQTRCSLDDQKKLNSVLNYLEKVNERSKSKSRKLKNLQAIEKARAIVLKEEHCSKELPLVDPLEPISQEPPSLQESENELLKSPVFEQNYQIAEEKPTSDTLIENNQEQTIPIESAPSPSLEGLSGEAIKKLLEDTENYTLLNLINGRQFLDLVTEIKKTEHFESYYHFFYGLCEKSGFSSEKIFFHLASFIEHGKKLDIREFFVSLTKDPNWKDKLDDFSIVRAYLVVIEIISLCQNEIDPEKDIVALLELLSCKKTQIDERRKVGELLARSCDASDIPVIMCSFIDYEGKNQGFVGGFITEIVKEGNLRKIQACLSNYWSHQSKFQTEVPFISMSLISELIDTPEKLGVVIRTLKNSKIYKKSEDFIIGNTNDELSKIFIEGVEISDPEPKKVKLPLKEKDIRRVLFQNNIFI